MARALAPSNLNTRSQKARLSSAPLGRELEVTSSKLSPTEQRNPRSRNLDKLSLKQAIRLMLKEEAQVPARLLANEQQLQKAVALVVRALQNQGRLYYVGAGTSGRLGVLDASECPPTFRTPLRMVQAIIAGGNSAVFRAVEGAEDDAAGGARALQARRVNARDVVVGLTASGTTRFVWGALGAAKKARATTMLICFNPYVRIPRRLRPSLVIATDLGPELLTGSTRLKAGTATKLILNLLTTLAMVQLGKVKSNLMVDLDPGNLKLRGRAVRIVRALTGASQARAIAALKRSDWTIRRALEQL